MRAKEAIAQADELRPNALGEKQKLDWVLELEKEVSEMMSLSEPPPAVGGEDSGRIVSAPTEKGRGLDEGEEPQLLLPPPRDRVYVLYLTAMIDFYNGEMDLYANDYALYNQEMAATRAWWRRHHRPRASRNWRV